MSTQLKIPPLGLKAARILTCPTILEASPGKTVFSSRDVAEYLDEKRGVVTRRMRNLAQEGLLTWVDDGLFCVTEKGRDVGYLVTQVESGHWLYHAIPRTATTPTVSLAVGSVCRAKPAAAFPLPELGSRSSLPSLCPD